MRLLLTFVLAILACSVDASVIDQLKRGPAAVVTEVVETTPRSQGFQDVAAGPGFENRA